MNFLLKQLPIVIVLFACWLQSFSQCPAYEMVGKQITAINTNPSLPNDSKLAALYSLKANAERCQLLNDSTYAILLRSIGYYENAVHKNSELAIRFTAEAIRINNTLTNRRSKHLTCVAYYSIGYYSEHTKLYRQALAYYDSAANCSNSAADIQALRLPSRQSKANIYFLLGDYQKSGEECLLGMNDAAIAKDTLQYLIFLNIKAQAFCFQNSLPQAEDNAALAMQLAGKMQDTFELATAYKTTGLVLEKRKAYNTAKGFFIKAIEARKHTGDHAAIASDYNDLGNFYLSSVHDYAQAKKNFLITVSYAQKIEDTVQHFSKLAMAYSNLGDNSFEHNKPEEAAGFYTIAFKYLNVKLPGYAFYNPTEAQLRTVEHKELVYSLLIHKTSLLLQQYTQYHNAKYLDACLQTAQLTDSVITSTRHEQIGEYSKLFWRNNTRAFFASAIQACYLAGNAEKAFYFMEKSRAVLLNDKLNEMGALAHLPSAEAAKQEDLQIKIMEAQQQLAALNPSSQAFESGQYKLVQARMELERYIQSLEQQYPAYYQYKYADNVPALASLQQYLKTNHQSFVHYFMNDTILYALGITCQQTKFIRLAAKDFDTKELTAFLDFCSNKNKLNSSYHSFALLAQHIYDKLFKQLQLPPGSVAICTDNFLIPFEALCTNTKGDSFLVYQYNFNYVYSARTLMKPVAAMHPAGNFIGFAPVSFAPYLRLVALQQSAQALSQSAAFYSNHTLFTGRQATRLSFFNNASGYAVISIFSHAAADTSNREPVLFMQDSAIQLSELQLLKKTTAQFVLLSACQTNIGKTATGEGIYSLARGFAAAGIPSVAGTLWKADDQTIYSISAKFNEYLTAGMSKSEALQKAKLWFIESGDNDDHRLPYYWANIVLIGNPQPLVLAARTEHTAWWMAGSIALLLLVIVLIWLYIKRKNYLSKNSTSKLAGTNRVFVN